MSNNTIDESVITSKENNKSVSENVPEIIKHVNSGNLSDVENYIISGKSKIDECDDNGMTSLHHAAYKGNFPMCKLLIQYGADVNANSHNHDYSTLHFAALSGKVDVVKLLLKSGAKTYHMNSLKRTAAQMAGFVGNRAVVAVINNYLPVSEVEYYSTIQGLETEPKLPKAACKPLHNIVMMTNLHPVNIALSVGESPDLMAHIDKAAKVLELMCEKESKRAENINEVLCLKFHFLCYILKTLSKEIKRKEESDQISSKTDTFFEKVIKKWLIGRSSDGFEECLEYYVQDAIRSFPYVEMPLFLQIAKNVSSKAGDSWALDVVHSVIYGQNRFQADPFCSTCGTENKNAKKCSKCKSVQYCNALCQKLHWSNHKKFCPELAKKYKPPSVTDIDNKENAVEKGVDKVSLKEPESNGIQEIGS